MVISNPTWDHSHDRPILICCRHCRSTDVRRDAYAEWDAELQRWVLGAVFDDGHCETCEGEATLIERWRDTGLPVSKYDLFRGEDWPGSMSPVDPDGEWSGSPCPEDPDGHWIDDRTGERIKAEDAP